MNVVRTGDYDVEFIWSHPGSNNRAFELQRVASADLPTLFGGLRDRAFRNDAHVVPLVCVDIRDAAWVHIVEREPAALIYN